MIRRYIGMSTTGRSGQASLAKMMNDSLSGCFAAFEYPDFRPFLPGALGDIERHFRRRFVETHELLGRGKVITAFDRGDSDYLERIAARRLARIENEMHRRGDDIFIDVSKYFIRGLHRAICEKTPGMSLIFLVRDPLENMRSFLNRDKNFQLDNSLPNAPHNQLRLDWETMEKGELYLWCWFEVALRHQDLMDHHEIEKSITIRTDDLADADAMGAHFKALDLPFGHIEIGPPVNTNQSRNLPATAVNEEDRKLLERFINRVPASVLDRVGEITGYEFTQGSLVGSASK